MKHKFDELIDSIHSTAKGLGVDIKIQYFTKTEKIDGELAFVKHFARMIMSGIDVWYFELTVPPNDDSSRDRIKDKMYKSFIEYLLLNRFPLWKESIIQLKEQNEN